LSRICIVHSRTEYARRVVKVIALRTLASTAKEDAASQKEVVKVLMFHASRKIESTRLSVKLISGYDTRVCGVSIVFARTILYGTPKATVGVEAMNLEVKSEDMIDYTLRT
jgi:hypothetical protein